MRGWSPSNKPIDPCSLQQPHLYVASRRDGWHKVGHCFGDAKFRAYWLHYRTQHDLRPVRIVWSVPVQRRGILSLERSVHKRLDQLGFERAGQKTNTEWFNAPAKECIAAIREAMETWPDVTERMMRNLGKSGRN